MEPAVLDALVEAAAEAGVECDGLVVERRADGFHLSVEGEAVDGLAEAELRERLADHAEYVRNWHAWAREAPPGEDGVAFLRWVEDAEDLGVPERHERLRDDGIRAEWGQLLISARLGDDGRRRYGLRHVDDADAAATELEAHDDPLALREVATYDEDGRYRPLKTAPTLRTGWTCPELAPEDLVRAVEVVYPATIANWHREREGRLDVDHWRETAERQTGIYDLLDELPREAVDWVAEACCVDSQCLKRREWDHADGDELDVPRGDGEFPCREPCSLVIAAARQFTILEGESERTVELELTTSELRQLEGLVDAVAEGRVYEVREADVGDPANRFRARYLRAKRFDGDGHLELAGEDADAAEE